MSEKLYYQTHRIGQEDREDHDPPEQTPEKNQEPYLDMAQSFWEPGVKPAGQSIKKERGQAW